MTPAVELFWELTIWLEIELKADGDKLRFRPVEAMTPDLLRRAKRHKKELLAIVRSGRTYADLAIGQFLEVAVPTPDGNGLYAPAETDRLTAPHIPPEVHTAPLAHAARPGDSSGEVEAPDASEREESALERAIRYRAAWEHDGYPPGIRPVKMIDVDSTPE